MTIFLHIGTHKTGTTAIQRHLGRNASFYASQGLWYPREAELLSGGRDAPTHLNIARSLDCTSKPKHYSEAQLQEMAQALREQSRQYAHTIISAEAFWRIGFGRIDGDDGPDQMWHRKAENVELIRRLLGSETDVEVVCVIRERATYLQSSYSEFILATFYRKPILKFLKSFRHVADYQRQLKVWQQHFPVRALSYEKLCEQQDITQRFLHNLVGPIAPPPDAGEQKTQFNVGHPIPCVLFKRYLNGMQGLPREQLIRMYNKGRRRFTKISDTSAVSSLKQINSWLTPKEIRSLRRSFRADDDQIRANFCPEFVSGPMKKDPSHDSSITPLSREAQYLTLGWMLSQKQPTAAWFHPLPRHEHAAQR
jgi:hypothetical protein